MLKTIISPVKYLLTVLTKKYKDSTPHMYNRDQVNPPPSADDCGNGEGQDRETVLTKHRSERWFLKERATKLGEEVHNDVVSAAECWRGCDLYKTTVVTDTHTHSAHRACRSWWGVGGGREGHIQNMVLSVQEYESGGRGRCIHFGKVESVVDFQMRIIYAWYLTDIGYFISCSKKSCSIFETV